MYYRFQPQVYPVAGASGVCIYDLSQRKLWHASADAFAILRRACSDADAAFSPAESEMLRQMCDAGLLTESEAPAPFPDITELRGKPVIRQAWIEICTDCNLHCRHCYNEASGSGIRMSQADFSLVCDRLTQAGIEIFTNGTLLTEAHCRLLKALGIRLALSVYSDTPEMHDAVTGHRGSHAAVMQTIALLRQYEIPFRTAAIAMKGIESPASADVVRMSGRGSLDLLSPALLRRKLITKDSFRRPLDPARVAAAVSGNPCFARKIYIAADLTVFPCVMERRLQHSSLRHDPLDAVLSPEILHWNRDRIPACSICEYRYACAPCLPDACSDDPAEKPYFCTYDAASGIWNDPAAQIAAILGGNT